MRTFLIGFSLAVISFAAYSQGNDSAMESVATVDTQTKQQTDAIVFRRAYYRPMPGMERVDQPYGRPLPLYVEQTDFLTSTDFISAKLISKRTESSVSVILAPQTREKLNQIASINAKAKSLEDYVGLLRYLYGVRIDLLMIVSEPLTKNEIWINHLTESEAVAIVKAINQSTLPRNP